MTEIVLSEPNFNLMLHTDFSHNSQVQIDVLDLCLKKWQVTPAAHPLAVDLCSGQGAIPALLVERGWNPRDITCIDWTLIRKPFIEGANWLCWDLKEMATLLLRGCPMPIEVERYAQKFDLVTLFLGLLGTENERALVNYFVKPNGVIIASSHLDSLLDSGIFIIPE